MKTNCHLFKRFFKVKKNSVFLFGISFFVIEIFTFLYYANEESDDVIDGAIKTVGTLNQQYLQKYWSSVLQMCITKGREWHLLSCCHGNTLGPILFLWKTKHPHFQPFKAGQCLTPNTHGSHIVLTIPIRLLGVDDLCLRWNLGSLVLIKTGPVA